MSDLSRYCALLSAVFLLTTAFCTASAQDPPKRVIAPQLTDGASDVHAVDLDGDGDSDILSSSLADEKIAWYENINGSFSDQSVISTSAGEAESVYAADLDGDGDMDALSASRGDDKIAWYENTGGSFSELKVISTDVERARSVHATDLDNDGDVDILSASSADDKVAWYENTDDDSFSSQKVISNSAEGAYSVHTADIDGDGDQDVLAALNDKDEIVWYENNSGSFASEKVITTDVDAPRSVFATDLDGDDDPDVLSASVFDDKIAWYENTGGSFSSQKVISSNVGVPESVYAADLDDDGAPDVLSASWEDNAISVFENEISTDGGFGGELVVSTNAERANSVYAADLDGDSDPDVLSASSGDDKISYYENKLTEGHGFGAQQNIVPRDFVEGISMVATADLDGDGDSDVLSASHDDNEIAWYTNEPDGFSNQSIITESANDVQSVHAADMDQDSDVDVVAGFSNKVAWYENDGGSFSNSETVTVDASGIRATHAADLDGDGDSDVLVASGSGDEIFWLENVGSGSLSSKKTISTNVNTPNDIYAADLDGDSDLDVLSASGADGKIAWYENAGDGSFSDQNIITTSLDRAQAVHAVDLDKDSDLDVLSASSNDDKVAWYENTDSGFSNPNVITTGSNEASSVYAADLNGDGHTDVMSASFDGIQWYESSESFGSVSFSSAKDIDSFGRGLSVRATDLTGNTQPDVVGGLRYPGSSDQVSWYENTSSTLPVELVHFEVQTVRTNHVMFTWQTKSEIESAGFEVQQQKESGWMQVGYVDSKAPGGTKTETKSYSYTAEDLPVGSHQFRLRQVDLDGSSTLIDPVSVDIQMQEALKLTAPAPNPASTSANLSFAVKQQAETTIRLYNTLGQQVATVYDGTPQAGKQQTARVDVSGLSSGAYFLRLQAGGQTRTQRLTVVR